ncbi:MAG TPA: DUF3575 domain-containing protein [Candidatus Coprenecus stercoravium]|uniref:DUF3575 domain-containing protein n=1 Tax=Candidatus Coprenecus stercoravium TaxID=2840735 RepID=A0A9D2KB20_9BACT|nr:DUF3575 domain-containing protein [Candidatus Coprenecus stercoravium]
MKKGITALILFFIIVNAGILHATDKDSICAARIERLYGGEPVRTAVKLNAAVALGVVNPAVEFRVHENISVSLEGLGVFYPKGVGKLIDGPVVVAMTFLEGRYYPIQSFRGFFVGPNIGFSVWDLSKGIHPQYWGAYASDYQVGTNFMAGLTIGYAFTLTKHWGIELSLGGGVQVGFYEGHYKSDGSMYVGWNGSTEWLPYKAAVNIVYKW